MTSVTLGEGDRAVLERLATGRRDVDTLASETPHSPRYLRERLPELADNGLVEAVDDGYEITPDGRRVLAATARGALGERFDTPPAVDDALRSLGLRPDRETAVRSSFAFLQFWGDAFDGEIVDSASVEHPAGFDDRWEWWTEGVREHLAGLPTVEPPTSPAGRWRYDGTPIVAEGEDGRDVLGTETASRNSPRFALERVAAPPETVLALRSTFAHLVEHGTVDADDLAWTYDERDTGSESVAEWVRTVRRTFDRIPRVDRIDEDDAWRYRPPR